MKCQILSGNLLIFRFATRVSCGADLDQRQHGGEHHPGLLSARWTAQAHCQVGRRMSKYNETLCLLFYLLQMAPEWRIPGFVI